MPAISQLPSISMSRNASTSSYGEWLRKKRLTEHYTLEYVADRAGTSNPVISNLERGTRNPSRDMAKRIGVALAPPGASEVYVEELIDESLVAAGFLPEGRSYAVTRVTEELVYEPIMDDLEAAAQSGNLDGEAIRRIRRQIEIETEEAARRRGAKTQMPGQSGED